VTSPKQDAALEVPVALGLGPEYVGAPCFVSEFVGARYVGSEFVRAACFVSEFVGARYVGSEFVRAACFVSEQVGFVLVSGLGIGCHLDLL
jgi:hypothetical protein